MHPKFAQLLETHLIVDFIHQNNSIRASVVGWNYWSEILWPSRVPYLHLYVGIVDLQGFELEIDADGRNGVGGKYIVHEAQQKTTFPHPGTARDDYLKPLVVVF